jgi:uncharacterized protein YndB with AHSA1/START domain
MSQYPLTHGSFSIERHYPASPAQVFAAWSSIDAKARWFIGPEDWVQLERSQDFRVGGSEVLSGRRGGDWVSHFNAQYHDIVPDERIIYAYTMTINDTRISVSLATVELFAQGDGSRLVFTEQAAFFDSEWDLESREHGTAALLDNLGRALGAA